MRVSSDVSDFEGNHVIRACGVSNPGEVEGGKQIME
jgi:hypothetical protein